MDLAIITFSAFACSAAMSIVAFMVGRCSRRLPVDGMTRGRRGSLALRRRALPSPPPCRFIPALSHNPVTGLPTPLRILCRLTRGNRQ